MDELIFDCPEDIQKLIADGWQADQNKRPFMNDFIEVLNKYPINVEQLKF